MQIRWWFSQFYRDEALNNLRIPICAAYGFHYLVPSLPLAEEGEDGWALVLMMTTPHQLDAAKPDPRVQVLSQVYDPTPLPAAVIACYAKWGATPGMNLGALLAKLEETEPMYGHSIA